MTILNGIDNLLEDVPEFLKKSRVAVFTNRSGITQDYIPNYVALKEKGVPIEFILTPEHGLYGAFQAGEKVEEEYELLLGIPLISTYGKKENLQVIQDVDIVIFDLQDVGLRFYTYLSSLKQLMEVIKDQKLIILDRINPLGRKVEGGIIKDGFFSFVGSIPVPIRHGITLGELALLINETAQLNLDMEIVKVKGWNGEDISRIQNYPFVPPSPAINTPQTIFYYMLTVFFEGTNISEGRGTYNPFKIFGAPFFDLRDHLNLEAIYEGEYRFLPLEFVPSSSKYRGEKCRGFEIIPLKPFESFCVLDGLILFSSIHELYRENFEFVKYGEKYFIDLLIGSPDLREKKDDIIDKWLLEAKEFEKIRQEFLLY